MSVRAQRQSELLDAEAIWRDFHERLLGFVARRVPDRDSAEDILQEVMLRIHRQTGDTATHDQHAPPVHAAEPCVTQVVGRDLSSRQR